VSIKLLPPEIYNKIAAGEVVENPASVVKELVENSIDANATHIRITIKASGKKEITVSDNGDGINPDEIELAFSKHATSKITDVDDLEQIHTLGFRGEALSSIASVSKVTLLTCVENAPAAVQVCLENGRVLEKKEAARSRGTTITVERLFENVPARLKFLKQDATELKYVKQILFKILLANPQLQMELVVDDNTAFRYTSVNNHYERIVQVYGDDFQEILMEARGQTDNMTLQAWISKPQFGKANRNYQFFFINHRAVDVNFFLPLLRNAYSGFMTAEKHAIAFIYLTADPAEVDVNVHPAKREVRFKNQSLVYDLIYQALRKSLTATESVTNVRPITLSNPFRENGSVEELDNAIRQSAEQRRENIKASISDFLQRHNAEEKLFQDSSPAYDIGRKEIDLTGKQMKQSGQPPANALLLNLLSEKAVVLGQVFNTYILVESGENLFLIDQHAGHERVIFERLKRETLSSKVSSQHLLIPFQVQVDPSVWDTIKASLDILQNIGYEVEDFGQNTLIVRAVPAYLRKANDKEMVKDLIDLIASEENRKLGKEILLDRMLDAVACRAAIKAGDRQTREEMEALINQLAELDNTLNCPHGRPFLVKVEKSEMEKWFMRRV
jgi:DNA mismatch repair protein MutL